MFREPVDRIDFLLEAKYSNYRVKSLSLPSNTEHFLCGFVCAQGFQKRKTSHIRKTPCPWLELAVHPLVDLEL